MTSIALSIQNDICRSFRHMTDDEKAKLWLQAALFAAGIYVSVTISLFGYCVHQLSTMNEQMIAMKATAFTAGDAEKLRDAIQVLSLKMATENNPKWLTEQVSKLQIQVNNLEREKRR